MWRLATRRGCLVVRFASAHAGSFPVPDLANCPSTVLCARETQERHCQLCLAACRVREPPARTSAVWARRTKQKHTMGRRPKTSASAQRQLPVTSSRPSPRLDVPTDRPVRIYAGACCSLRENSALSKSTTGGPTAQLRLVSVQPHPRRLTACSHSPGARRHLRPLPLWSHAAAEAVQGVVRSPEHRRVPTCTSPGTATSTQCR